MVNHQFINKNHRYSIIHTLIYFCLLDLDKSDSGTYTCVVSSRSGKTTWDAMLRLENPTNPNIHFFRAAELSTLPGAPSKPHIIDQTDSSATISWSRNNKIGSSSLLGYQVSYNLLDFCKNY